MNDNPRTWPHTWLVINTASGSYSEQAVADLVGGMQLIGMLPERTLAIPDEAAPDRAVLETAGVELLAIFTGDGTVNGVVSGLYGWGGAVLVLPGGTQNLLAKALHGDRSAEAIVARMGEGPAPLERRHMVRTSQGDALCEVLAGPGAHWSDVREAMREGDLGGMATTLGEAISQSTGGALVRITDPLLGKAEGYPAVRAHPVGGSMAIDGYGAATLADYARQGVALLRRDFREGPHDALGSHRTIMCRSDVPIELMIDGERSTGGCEERFEVIECPVEFFATNSQRGSS